LINKGVQSMPMSVYCNGCHDKHTTSYDGSWNLTCYSQSYYWLLDHCNLPYLWHVLH